MKIAVPAGNYVIAVSGGVDSIVLLYLLAEQAKKPDSNLRLVVAHFDHGIRPDSEEDRAFVQKLSKQYRLPFVYDTARLGPKASEAKARDARYAFLRKVQQAMRADAIITAHHQDDLLETVIINLLRGTKSRGLSSLRSTETLRRPLLAFTKQTIRDYAAENKLQWHEDSTNDDETYLRNYIRKQIMPRLSAANRKQLLEHSAKAADLNDAISLLTDEYLQKLSDTEKLDREDFRSLPIEVGAEILASWLRKHTNVTISRKLIARIGEAIQSARNGAQIDIARGYVLKISRNYAELIAP